MRILIIADESFAARERAMLSRLEVGLADESVRVIHAVPRRAAHWYHGEVYSQAVTYQDRGLAISRGWRAQQIVHELEGLVDGEATAVNVVHAFGQECWPVAMELARHIGAGLAVEVSDPSGAAAAVRLRSAEGGPPVLFVPDQTLERLIHAEDNSALVRVTPWGVHTPPVARDILQPGRDASIMIDGSGLDRPAMAALLEAIATVAPGHPELMAFADADAVRAAGVWPMVKKLGLLDRFTLTPDLEARRELALRADALILPEARGEHRSLMLDAMATGMVVVAAADPLIGTLIDGRTARLVERPSADRWAAVLTWMLEDRDAALTLASSAREYVRQHCRASSHVASVLDAYEWMSAGESIPFQAPGA